MAENHLDTSSSDDNSDEIDDKNLEIRQKRDIAWCGVDTEDNTPLVTWPPESTSNWNNLRHVQIGNPLYGTKMQLYSRTGYHLAIYPDNTVRGTQDETDLHTYLELSSAHQPGHVRIFGHLSKLYIGMDSKGRIYGESDPNDDDTIFIEMFQGSYTTYLSKKYAHLNWYLGIKKSGKLKKASKTAYGQKAIQFLPRRNRFE